MPCYLRASASLAPPALSNTEGNLRTDEEQPHRPSPPKSPSAYKGILGLATGEKIEVTSLEGWMLTVIISTQPALNTLKEHWEEELPIAKEAQKVPGARNCPS